MTPIRAVIFDFGNVLLRWAPGEVVDRLFQDPAVAGTVMRSVFQHPDWLEVDRGTYDEAMAAARAAARTGLPVESMVRLLEQARESLSPLPESVVMLRDLAVRGVPLYGLSNMHSDTFRHLKERFDFWALFKGIVISGDVGLIKPDHTIFELLLQRFELEPAQTVFIDDSLPNVLTARQMGLRGIHFSNAAACAAELYPMLG